MSFRTPAWKIVVPVLLVAALVLVPHVGAIDLGAWSHHLNAAAAMTVAVPASLDKQLVLSYEDLRSIGISYHRVHLRRMWLAGKFPKPFKLGAGPAARNGWFTSEILNYLEKRAAARDGVDAS